MGNYRIVIRPDNDFRQELYRIIDEKYPDMRVIKGDLLFVKGEELLKEVGEIIIILLKEKEGKTIRIEIIDDLGDHPKDPAKNIKEFIKLLEFHSVEI